MIKLKQLPYEMNALEPYISAKTVEFHYTKHHQGYVNNLNNLIEGTEFAGKDLEEIIKTSEGPIFNNAAQVWNHTFYWEGFSADPQKEPKGKLAELINAKWGSFEKFKEEFTKTATGLFGSAWAWLVIDPKGELKIVGTSNAATPLTTNDKALLTADVWEHAYYLDYQNLRATYLKSFWELVDWKKVEARM
ncbi:MAG: superoxide dismutase [Bacteroidota bacterium]|jgi:Fe-Mn family superoxide dismutase|nr:superoxide dismutase [Bacteroidota bacterium]NLP19309.1 superoxide dismutase [Bacteroidales bacterium]OQC43931.1 MAG: Superoxide dismutase (Fe) [Bacteroidetes bacterium ADurb.Bin028]HNY44864.1 superoxide dismutase [Bacteroidales bacterium]HOD87534.1 superoxide dismutase [Bacteroidales bacterium]